MTRVVDADKKLVADLLGGAGGGVIVPDYQRSYSWTKDETRELWDDVIRFEARLPAEPGADEYFLGSLVAFRARRDLTLLDGQQRLATVTVLLAAIRDALAPLDEDSARTLHMTLIQEVGRPRVPPRNRLTLSVYDRDFFSSVVQQFPRPARIPAANFASHRLIRQAKEFFDRELEQKLAEFPSDRERINWLERLWTVLGYHLSVVVVLGEGEDDATDVFEVLNDRGAGLTTIDLLRNFLLGQVRSEEERRIIVDWWREVFAVSDNPARVQAFLRHFWIARYGDVKARGLYKEIKERLRREFAARETNPRDFSVEISVSAEVYRSIVAATTDSEDLNSALEDVRNLGANALYPVLLASVERYGANEIALLAQGLISLYVRWAVIGRLESTVLERDLYETAQEVSGGLDLAAARERITVAAPTDPEFERAFRTASVARPGQRRHVLVRLEKQMRAEAREDEVEPRSPSTLHVEHIYPQTPAEGAEWPDHEDWIDRIGNLTLLHRRWNTSIKNGDFNEVKKPELRRSVILLNRSVLEAEDWSRAAIEQRQEELARLAPTAWPI